MHAEIELEVLRSLDRPELERLQIHALYLRDLVNRHARSLSLRSIQDVCVSASCAPRRVKKRNYSFGSVGTL